MMDNLNLISIGYEKRNLEEFVKILNDLNVKLLLDVRELPLSRKKGFSKNSLKNNMEWNGIDYLHFKLAGNPFRKLKANVKECLSLYEGHLEENPEIITELKKNIKDYDSVAFICYEREHVNCHRSVLIKKLSLEDKYLNIKKIE